MSERTQELLKQAGWHPGRRVDTAAYETALREEGYPLPAVVLEFLSQFGGLEVTHPHKKVPGQQD